MTRRWLSRAVKRVSVPLTSLFGIAAAMPKAGEDPVALKKFVQEAAAEKRAKDAAERIRLAEEQAARQAYASKRINDAFYDETVIQNRIEEAHASFDRVRVADRGAYEYMGFAVPAAVDAAIPRLSPLDMAFLTVSLDVPKPVAKPKRDGQTADDNLITASIPRPGARLKVSPAMNPYKLPKTVQAHFTQLERERGMPRGLLAKMFEIESSGNCGTPNSSKGARGCFQFMPGTWDDYAPYKGASAHNVYDASTAAAAYLNDLRRQFGSWRTAVEAYNNGPRNVQKRRGTNKQPPAETRKYLNRVGPVLAQH